jgi:hypothetical protein
MKRPRSRKLQYKWDCSFFYSVSCSWSHCHFVGDERGEVWWDMMTRTVVSFRFSSQELSFDPKHRNNNPISPGHNVDSICLPLTLLCVPSYYIT